MKLQSSGSHNNCAPLGMSYTYNWSLATLSDINKYQCVLNELLNQLSTPCVMSKGDPAYNRQLIDDYYTSIVCFHSSYLQCFDAVGWAAGRASGL